MQKEITLSQIKATYTKDFQTFGRMDPFLVFSIGKCQAKTETANGMQFVNNQDAGKQPQWKSTLVLNYFDQAVIIVKSYQEDLSTNQYMGEGRIDVKPLKNSGSLEIKIMEQNSNVIGTIYCKYVLKTLPPSPVMVIKNIRCEFYKQTKFLIKTKPYFSIGCLGKTTVSEIKNQGNATSLSWDQNLRIKIKEGQKISFNVQDKNDQNKKIFGYETLTKQFRTLAGSKSFNVIDKNYEPLGVITFDYETQNFVNKEQSVKNQQTAKKETNEMYQIVIQKIEGNLNKADQDLYFKINVGPTMFKTEVIKNSKKDFVMEAKQLLYSDRKQNKIIFAAYDKDVTYDDFLGVGQLSVQGLVSGEKTISLKDDKGDHFGDIILTLTCKKIVCKQLIVSDIKVILKAAGDAIGQSDPFVVAKVGGWSQRTETAQGSEVIFKKSLTLKFSQQKQALFEVYDEDVTSDELLYAQKINIEDLKQSGNMKIVLKKQWKDDKKNGELSFKYVTKNVIAVSPKKQDLKKSQKIIPVEQPKKQQPKKQQSKKQEPKVEQTKKQQSKKQQPKKEQNKDQKKVQSQKNLKPVKTQEKQKTENNSNLNKSKATVKLPNINDPKNYGDRIFDKQSTSTLQKSILVYSMPKAQRFGTGPKYSGEPSYYVDSCFNPKNGKGAGFGFGSKKQFPDWMERNMKQNPAPGSYIGSHENSDDLKNKGPTFGISYKYYEKVTIPKQKSYRSTQRLKPIAERRMH